MTKDTKLQKNTLPEITKELDTYRKRIDDIIPILLAVKASLSKEEVVVANLLRDNESIINDLINLNLISKYEQNNARGVLWKCLEEISFPEEFASDEKIPSYPRFRDFQSTLVKIISNCNY